LCGPGLIYIYGEVWNPSARAALLVAARGHVSCHSLSWHVVSLYHNTGHECAQVAAGTTMLLSVQTDSSTMLEQCLPQPTQAFVPDPAALPVTGAGLMPSLYMGASCCSCLVCCERLLEESLALLAS